MLKKLICLIFGHQWRETGRDTGGDVDNVTQKCGRCGTERRGMNL
jgi:hypothetical protein